jgi:arylsulfatase A-like enzyme
MILKVNIRNCSTLAIAGMILNVPLLAAEGSRPLRPNVVFILADDLGWMDLGCYGSTFYDTPNIDALADRGLRFTQAYMASPLCAPARASILTGLDPARTGMTYPDIGRQVVNLEKRLQESAPANAPRLLPEPVTVLSTDHYTLGMAFRKAGYAMGHYGKWHLGRHPYSPLQHGFDIDIPHTNAPGPLLHGYFHPFPVWPDRGEPGNHLEDMLADEAVRFIRANKDRPFFLNYWAFQVHSPWEAKPEQIDKFEARADSGDLQRNPVYAAMVESLDDAVGALVEALEDAGILDRTIIIFVSDNGPFIAAHPSPVMLAGYEDVPVTSVLPLRGGKMTVYEGGIRVPLIMIWPGLTEAGTVTSELVHSNDFFPGFIDLLGLPAEDAPDFDGVSFRPILEGGNSARDEIFCHFPHNQDTRRYEGMTLPLRSTPAASLRKGDWKLIRFFADHPDGSDRYELYNLAIDPGELHDKTSAETERFSQLREILEKRLQETEAIIPQRNPAYRRK